MKFSDLRRCPFCGCDEFYEKRYARGPVRYYMAFNPDWEANNSEMYSSLSYEGTGRAYCADCDRVLGNFETGTVAAQAIREIEKGGVVV